MTTTLIGTDVDVYWNLHRHTWSIRDRKSRLVVAHLDALVLSDVRFRVSAAGNARVRSEGRKNVHAFARGTVVSVGESVPSESATSVTYNPYQYTTFVEADTGTPVHDANMVWLSPRKVFATV